MLEPNSTCKWVRPYVQLHAIRDSILTMSPFLAKCATKYAGPALQLLSVSRV